MKKVAVLEQRRLLDAFFKIDEAVLRHQRRDGSLSPPLSRLNLERGDGVAALEHVSTFYRPRAVPPNASSSTTPKSSQLAVAIRAVA